MDFNLGLSYQFITTFCKRAHKFGNLYLFIINFTVWMETQRQTNGDAITVGGWKPELDNSIDKDQIA